MLRSIGFVAMLFCFGLAGLLVGGLNLYEMADWRFNGKTATMRIAEPGKKTSLGAPGGPDIYPQDVKYIGSDGEVLVPQKWMSRAQAQKLLDGEGIPITYLSHNPQHVMYAGDRLDSPWGWLIVGAGAMATFIYALRMLRRESDPG